MSGSLPAIIANVLAILISRVAPPREGRPHYSCVAKVLHEYSKGCKHPLWINSGHSDAHAAAKKAARGLWRFCCGRQCPQFDWATSLIWRIPIFSELDLHLRKQSILALRRTNEASDLWVLVFTPLRSGTSCLEDNAVTQRAYRPTKGFSAAFAGMRALHDVTDCAFRHKAHPVDALWFLRMASPETPRRS